MSFYIQRVSAKILRSLSFIVNEEIKNDKIGYISITFVKTTNDLSYATVYYSIFKQEKENLDLCAKALETHKIAIRNKLAHYLKDIKKTPQLIFKFDTSLEYEAKIERLLKEVK